MRSFLACAAVVVLSGTAHAQQQPNPLSYEALTRARPGQWAEYTLVRKSGQSAKLKWAMVEKSDKGLGIEVDSQTQIGPVLMHLGFEPAGPQGWKLARARMQTGTQTQDIGQEQINEGVIKKNDPPGKLLGTETLKTPAGTLACKHYQKALPQGGAVEMWTNDRVLPTGMVKMVTPDGDQIVLSAMGTGAKARLSLSGPPAAPPAAAKPATTPEPAAAPASAKPATHPRRSSVKTRSTARAREIDRVACPMGAP
jgi:hypothetical protein